MAKAKAAAVAELPVAKPAPETNGKKPECSVSRKQFAEGAKPVVITVADRPMLADPREFSTGSLGWFTNEKSVINVGGEAVRVQVQTTITVIGSKDLPK